MTAETFLSFCWTSLFVFVFVSAEQKTITVGRNVTLTCRAPNNNSAAAVEWSRADLKTEHVLLYRDGQFDTEFQHPSFKDRVELQDRQMKDGDVSLILMKVMINDTGTYECRVIQSAGETLKLISTITLRVVAPPPPPGPTGGTSEDGGSVGLIVGLSVSALLLLAAAVGFVIYRKHKQQNQDPHPPSAEPQPV